MSPCWEYCVPTWAMLQWLASHEKVCLSTVIIGRRYLLLRKRHWMPVWPRTERLCWSVWKHEAENCRKNPDTAQMGGYSPCLLDLAKGLDTRWGCAQQLYQVSELSGRTSLIKQTQKCLHCSLVQTETACCHRGDTTSQKKDSGARGHHICLHLSQRT